MNKPYVIGIAGGSGSGKTFFLNCFLKHFSAEEVCLISQDDYYIPVAEGMTAEENKLYNFDLPKTIDAEAFMADAQKLLNHQTVYKKEYTFNNAAAVPKMLEIKSAPVIIIEGLFILHFRELAEILDMRIFIDSEEEIALHRRLKRDLLERGYSEEDVRYKWSNHVMPAYKEYLLPYKLVCDKVVVNNTQIAEDIVKVTQEISKEVRGRVLI
ncbi:uridine kinase family protein [Mucilaginibacter sp.]|uniref:uridine kinase family protein n=1 Tax=Mucilaginibacter sp. TaxID=1882438 RepID=UPI003AFFF992